MQAGQRFVRLGKVRPGSARIGVGWRGRQAKVRERKAGQGSEVCGRRGIAGRRTDGCEKETQGRHGSERLSPAGARMGQARQARNGAARRRWVGTGPERRGRRSWAGIGNAGRCLWMARQCEAGKRAALRKRAALPVARAAISQKFPHATLGHQRRSPRTQNRYTEARRSCATEGIDWRPRQAGASTRRPTNRIGFAWHQAKPRIPRRSWVNPIDCVEPQRDLRAPILALEGVKEAFAACARWLASCAGRMALAMPNERARSRILASLDEARQALGERAVFAKDAGRAPRAHDAKAAHGKASPSASSSAFASAPAKSSKP